MIDPANDHGNLALRKAAATAKWADILPPSLTHCTAAAH